MYSPIRRHMKNNLKTQGLSTHSLRQTETSKSQCSHVTCSVAGHYYVIGECGRPTEVASCPECRSAIGGENHALVGGNRQAPEFDNAEGPVWTEERDLEYALMLQQQEFVSVLSYALATGICECLIICFGNRNLWVSYHMLWQQEFVGVLSYALATGICGCLIICFGNRNLWVSYHMLWQQEFVGVLSYALATGICGCLIICICNINL